MNIRRKETPEDREKEWESNMRKDGWTQEEINNTWDNYNPDRENWIASGELTDHRKKPPFWKIW